MRVAVVQFGAGRDKVDNLARLVTLIERAANEGAQLVVAPEVSMYDAGATGPPLGQVAEPLDGAFVTGVAEVAKRRAVTALVGMYESVRDLERVYNTVVAIGPVGELIGSYRKQHLFDALGWMESDRVAAGDPEDRLVIPVEGMKVGVMTCYDIRFPELARALVDDGAELIAVPSAWVAGDTKLEQWQVLMTARAIENVCYVAGAVQPPPTYTGGSRIVDPWGIELAAVDAGEGVAVADVSSERVAECRAKMPSLSNRRWKVEPR